MWVPEGDAAPDDATDQAPMKWLPAPIETRITLGSPKDLQGGLLAYAALRFDGFLLDGLTVRRTMRNELTVSYPSRHSGRHPHFLPTDPDWRRQLEEEVLDAYWREIGQP